MNIVVDVALAEGPLGGGVLADLEDPGSLFRLLMWMMTTQMTRRTMTMTAESTAPRKSM